MQCFDNQYVLVNIRPLAYKDEWFGNFGETW